MAGHLDAIVTLQKTLRELNEAKELFGGVPDWMQELHEEHSRRKAEIDEAEQALAEAEKEHRAATAELDDIDERATRLQGQVSQVATQREYGAILKEIDTVKESKTSAEERAETSMASAEELQGKLATLREEFQDLDQRYQTELVKWESQKPELGAKIEVLEKDAEAARKKLPRNTLVHFERLFGRYDGLATSPIVKLEGVRGNAMWHCEVCSYNVRPQVVLEIRGSSTIHTCDSCKRYLYLEDEAEEGAEEF